MKNIGRFWPLCLLVALILFLWEAASAASHWHMVGRCGYGHNFVRGKHKKLLAYNMTRKTIKGGSMMHF
jgi:hypothetical protein